MRRRRQLGAALGSALLAACWPAPGPGEASLSLPPLGPDEVAFAHEQGAAELTRWRLERDERWHEAIDPGELAEHVRRVREEKIADKSATVEAIFRQGEAFFDRRFTLREGLGHGLTKRAPPALSRVENAAEIGGPDALSCTECHGRGGDDGHGELHQRAWLGGDGRHLSAARPRLPPHLAGLGVLQALGAEMTEEIAAQVAGARATVEVPGGPAEASVELITRGIHFGTVVARRGGALETAGLRGIDPDMVVKPFGWKGVHATLRSFIEGALPQHMGLELPPRTAAERAAIEAAAAKARPIDPSTLVELNRLTDRDLDGKNSELEPGQLTSLSAYLALVDVPLLLPPRTPRLRGLWEQGAALFQQSGCASCHTPEHRLHSPKLIDRDAAGLALLELDLVRDNQVKPGLSRFDLTHDDLIVQAFSDLRRHDMGEGLADRAERGARPWEFLTRPLWGIADRGPFYLHDGRARTLREAILLHGGEAAASRESYARLAPPEAQAIEIFLLSLGRSPQGRIAP